MNVPLLSFEPTLWARFDKGKSQCEFHEAAHIFLLTGVLGYEAKNIIFSVLTESEIQTPFFASIYKILMVI